MAIVKCVSFMLMRRLLFI